MQNSTIGVAFSPDDMAALITWSEDVAARGVSSDMAYEGEDVAENLLVKLPGGKQPAFSLWTTSNGAYCLEDWRAMDWDMPQYGQDGVMYFPTLDAALHKIEREIVKCGRALPRVSI